MFMSGIFADKKNGDSLWISPEELIWRYHHNKRNAIKCDIHLSFCKKYTLHKNLSTGSLMAASLNELRSVVKLQKCEKFIYMNCAHVWYCIQMQNLDYQERTGAV